MDENLFEELENMGYNNVDGTHLFDDPVKGKKAKPIKKEITLEDVLYDKSYTCPICGNAFYSKGIRIDKNRVIKTDFDLKSTYSVVNPLLYECIICEKCGYAALNKSFYKLTTNQKQWIREQICANYKPTTYPTILTEKEAIIRFKIVLLTAQVKKARDSEKAYICLKTAWLYRDMKDEEKELLFLKNALTGFQKAFLTERFPIFGSLDESKTAYLIATIYYKLKNYNEALKWIGPLILKQNISPNLKSRALALKDMIRDEKTKNRT